MNSHPIRLETGRKTYLLTRHMISAQLDPIPSRACVNARFLRSVHSHSSECAVSLLGQFVQTAKQITFPARLRIEVTSAWPANFQLQMSILIFHDIHLPDRLSSAALRDVLVTLNAMQVSQPEGMFNVVVRRLP
jgi:hypothetical protein